MHTIKQILSSSAIALATLFFAFTLALSAPSNAQAGEFEAGIGFGYAGWVGNDHDGYLYDDDFNGMTFSLEFGYRINDWLGIFIEQDLGGLFYKKHHADIDMFYGATVFEGKVFYAIKALEIFGKLGIGATYAADSEDGYDWDNGWFALRLGVGATYYIGSNWGIGLNFDYTPSFDDDYVSHFLKFQAHFIFRF